MPLLKGKCPNFGLCTLADRGEILVTEPGKEFRCPGCNSKLTLLPHQGLPRGVLVLGTVVVLGGMAVGGWFFVSHGHGIPAQPAVQSINGSGVSGDAKDFEVLTDAQWNTLGAKVQAPLLDDPIVFRPGQMHLQDDDRAAIKDSLRKLESYARSRVWVEAHVAPSDSSEADQKLSDDRAAEVKNFLVADCGLPAPRVFAKGCGSTQPPPREPGETDQEWKRRARSVKILLVGP